MNCERKRSVVRRFAVRLAWSSAALLAVWLPGAVAAGQSMPAAGQPLMTRGAGLAYLGVRSPSALSAPPAIATGCLPAAPGLTSPLAVSKELGPLVRRMWEASPTFRRQCARLARGRRDDRRRAGPEDEPRADECVHPDPHGQRSGAGCDDAPSCLGTGVSRARDRTRPGASRRRRAPPVGKGRVGGRAARPSRACSRRLGPSPSAASSRGKSPSGVSTDETGVERDHARVYC